MLVQNLKAVGFRNFESADLSFDSGLNIFNGRNGSGKTNLLEAVFVLTLGRSQRGAADSVMLRENDDYYRLSGEIEIEGKVEEAAIAYQRGGRKKITIDKVGARASELFRHYTAVATSPEDIEILSGSPSHRRNFIDLYLSQASQKYLADLTDYQKALAQKNAFLKQDNNSGDTPYDDLLIDYGSKVMKHRLDFISSIMPTIAETYKSISGGHPITVQYNPSVSLADGIEDIDEIMTAFGNRLREVRERERIMQTAMTGPHRDDIDIAIRDLPARAYGSQGELRTAAISLKIAVYRYLKKVRRATPVLLMDEIFAELDDSRREMMIELFDEVGQVFITTASEIPDILLAKGRRFIIKRGAIKDITG